MYSKVTKLILWIKANFKVTQKEIDRVLATDYFREIDRGVGEYDDPFEYFFNEQSTDENIFIEDSFEKSRKDVDEHGGEVTILDMAKVFLNELGIENYSTNFLKYSLKLESGNECDIFKNIRMYLRLSCKLDKDAIEDIISYISIHGKKDRMRPCGKYLNDSMLVHLEDLIKANDVMYEESENLPSCEDVLKDKVNKAIKLLKYGYSLSEEQISLLASYNYNISSELSNNIAGEHSAFHKKIRISPRALEPMETILHEMVHALGIKKEGLTELLAENIYMKYKPLIASINSFEEALLIVKSYEFTFYDYLSPNSYNNNWSYFSISDRYRKLFRVLRDVNMENEIIDLVLNGVDI